jgi:hypothetical protein
MRYRPIFQHRRIGTAVSCICDLMGPDDQPYPAAGAKVAFLAQPCDRLISDAGTKARDRFGGGIGFLHQRSVETAPLLSLEQRDHRNSRGNQ